MDAPHSNEEQQHQAEGHDLAPDAGPAEQGADADKLGHHDQAKGKDASPRAGT